MACIAPGCGMAQLNSMEEFDKRFRTLHSLLKMLQLLLWLTPILKLGFSYCKLSPPLGSVQPASTYPYGMYISLYLVCTIYLQSIFMLYISDIFITFFLPSQLKSLYKKKKLQPHHVNSSIWPLFYSLGGWLGTVKMQVSH